MRLMSPTICVLTIILLTHLAFAQHSEHARLKVQIGHNGWVWAVAESHNGRFLATGGEDKTVRLWDSETEQELLTFRGHTASLHSVAFSRDDRQVLTSSQDGTVRLWETQTGRELWTFHGHTGFVAVAAFAPTGRYVLSGGQDKAARLVDAATGNEIRSFVGHTDAISSIAFSRDEKYVATSTEFDQTARLWDLNTGRELRRFEIGSGGILARARGVLAIGISADDQQVWTACSDGFVRVWDVQTKQQIRTIKLLDEVLSSMKFSDDLRYLLTGSVIGPGRLWDMSTGRQIATYSPPGDSVSAINFDPDGVHILTAASDGTARLWDMAAGKEIARYFGYVTGVGGFVTSANNDIALEGDFWGIVRLWDLRNGSEMLRWDSHLQGIFTLALSPNGEYAALGGMDGVGSLVRLETGAEIRRFGDKERTRVDALAFSPDCHYLAAGFMDHTAAIWDVASGKQISAFTVSDSPVDTVMFSPDSRTLLLTSDSAMLWDVATGRKLKQFQKASELVSSATFTPDGLQILTGGWDKIARLWDVATGAEIAEFDGSPDLIESVAISPNAKLVAAGGTDGSTMLWETGSRRLLRHWSGHTNFVHTVAFSADSRHLWSASWDGLTELWDPGQQAPVALLCAFSDGWAVVDGVGHYDGSNPDHSSAIFWVTDSLRTIEEGQMKAAYYAPGLLARVLRNERLPNVTGMDSVLMPPLIDIAGEYKPATAILQVNVTNDGGGVGKLLVQVNGRLLRTIDQPGQAREGQSFTLSINLSDAPFVAGDNIIQVTAYDGSNRIESHKAIAQYTKGSAPRGFEAPSPQSEGATGQFYAVIVGTSEFADPKMNLMFPAKDAETMAKGLRLGAERLYGKDRVWIRLLTSNAASEDGLPSKKAIRAAFDEVRRLARPEDTLLVYLSGHGAMSSTRRDVYYYFTADARTFDIEADSALKDVSTVSSSELFEWLREPVKTMPLKQVVILDTCAAGAAGDALSRLAEKRAIPPDQRRAIELLKDATGTYILMGSTADTVSYEASKYGEGLLTYALLEGMRGTALDDGSRLGVSRWFEQASERVPTLAKSIGGIQKPMIAAPKGSGFPVALLTKDDTVKIPLAMPKPQLLRVVCEDENQDDPLNLRDPLREQLRALNDIRERSSSPTDGAGVMYIDASDDELPGAFAPKLRYNVKGNEVSVRVRLVAERKTVAEKMVTAKVGDPQLPKMLADTIVGMAVGLTP